MTLYEQLGVEQSATAEEIKRAYYRLVRQYSPEKDPETFMRIRKAYEELADQDSRMAYNASLSRLDDISSDTAAIIIEAERLTTKGLVADAISSLERELVKHSEGSAAANSVLYALSVAYLNSGKSGKAYDIVDKLVSEYPERPEYLRLAAIVCSERGWTNKAHAFWSELDRIDPGNELNALAKLEKTNLHPGKYGRAVEKVEKCGKKAPLLCARILSNCFTLDRDHSYYMQYAQLELTAVTGSENLPWDDPLFAANKLAEHTVDIPAKARELVRDHLEEDILWGMYAQDRYDILPQVDEVIYNIGAEDLLQTSLYKVVSVAYAAQAAVRDGMPKTLAAYSVMRAFSQSDYCDEKDKAEFRIEVIAYEFDILAGYRQFRAAIRRLHDDYIELYHYSADFLDAIQRYNENKIYDEIDRRYSKLKHVKTRLNLEWLGEDDVIDVFSEQENVTQVERNEPVRVTKIGRNEPCPCGSGLKYKKCCGR